MSEFQVISARANSMSRRKLLFGIAVNDADYVVCHQQDGEPSTCPFYKVWMSMLVRCYSVERLRRRPSYSDCAVCDEWLRFSKFREWMAKQDWKEKHLDKDILIQDNKIYSPASCCFVDSQVNTLLNTHAAARGQHMIGVCWDKSRSKFKASFSVFGKNKHIGLYNNETEAHQAYCKAKYEHIAAVAQQQTDARIKNALLSYKIKEK